MGRTFMRSDPTFRFVLVTVMALSLACSGKDKKEEAAPASGQVAEHVTESPDPIGAWTIVAHRIPGVSARTEVEATAWHGRVIMYAEGHAASHDDTCRAATYGFETRPADRFLGESYHIAPHTLGIDKKTIDVMWVGCDGNPWAAPGGVLIWVDNDRVFTPWDGVFFELTRGAIQPVDPNVVMGTGLIVHMEIEGGFYAIQSDDGTTYDPRSLLEEFQVDSLRVSFKLRVIPDAMGTHQVGPIVDVVEMTRAE
ncbi:MAG TPA: hypothetical protein VFT13_05050 [Candidatus Krumholzibacteria bacterium]|nr:hypothetical protein [Candidatus Krumholzibacteria bacterium]